MLLIFLWTVFAVAARAKDGAATETPPPKPVAATTSIEDCVDENDGFDTRGRTYRFVFKLTNKCDKRLKCVIDAYVTGAKGPSSGHGTVILAPKSQGDAATKSFAMKVKLPGGTAQISRTCKAF